MAVQPKTAKILKILEPSIFPIDISLLPLIADIILTASSGALVPIDTIVKPTMIDGIPIFLDKVDAPSTKKSAPLIKRQKPIINNK